MRGKTLDCATFDGDRYGRSVVQCHVVSLDINSEMVRLGWATAYSRHGTTYLEEQAQARRGKRGLWRGTFENPEKWRERNRNLLMGDDLGE